MGEYGLNLAIDKTDIVLLTRQRILTEIEIRVGIDATATSKTVKGMRNFASQWIRDQHWMTDDQQMELPRDTFLIGYADDIAPLIAARDAVDPQKRVSHEKVNFANGRARPKSGDREDGDRVGEQGENPGPSRYEGRNRRHRN